jgi:predicted AAA+ superfamily ATPase
LDHKTIDEYIDCLCEAFLLYEVKRYDIKGKDVFKSKAKYYAVDMGFRNCIIGNTLDINRGKTIENIVFLELIRRGFTVHVGYIDRLEIDFVAVKGDEKIYVQVCESIEKEETFKKELAPLMSLKNSYKKYLIVGNTNTDIDNVDGIKIINCIDFLLN